MVRRRKAQEESDEEEDDYGPASAPPAKRARTQDSEDEVKDDEEDQGLDMGEEFDPNDDEEEEERTRARLDKDRAKARYSRRGAAEAGVISSLECEHFMCHTHFHLDFSQQINFITGRNGSGKSAALAAIQVGLGARPSLTGRGSSLQSLIQDNAEYAEIIIRMRNRGPEAFKPDLYGDTIKIIRRIRKGGTSSIQMKSADAKLISDVKSELQEMCDHFNIQIESPLSVLTQDAAKKFLSDSTPAEKYNFFLQGTQLTQLAEEYELIRSNVRKIQSAVSQQKEALPQMEEAAREAETKLSEAHKARGQKDRLQALKHELAWAHVAGKYEQLSAERDELHQLEKHPAKYRTKADEAQAKIDELTDKSKALEEQLTADKEENDKYQEERKVVQDQIRRNAMKIQECQGDEQEINQGMDNTQKLIDELEKKIEAESLKLQRDDAAKRQQILDQLGEVVSSMTAKEEEFQALGQEKQELETRARDLREQLKQANGDRTKVQQQLQEVQGWQRRIQDQQRNKLNAFGTNIDRVLQDIQNTRWQGSTPPIGPLGRYVSLKDGTYPPIVIAERDIFDYSQGLPQDSSIVTPLHVLECSDEWVSRILINAHSLERIGLTRNREEADRMAERDVGRVFWSADQFKVTKFRDGGFSSQGMPSMKGTDRRRQLFAGQDTAGQLRDAEERERQCHHQLDVISKEIAKANAALHDADQRRNRILNQGRAIHQEKSKLQREKERLEELSREEAPQEVAGLEAVRDDHVRQKEEFKASFKIVYERRLQLDAENKPLLETAKRLREHLDRANEVKQRIHAEMSKLFDQTVQAKSNHKHYRDKLAEAERNVTAHQEKLAITEEEYTTWHAKASEYCAEVMNPRNASQVRKEVEALEKAVKQRERRQGASVDEMEAECVRTKRALEKTNAAIKGLEEMAHKLEFAVKVRIETWHTFRRNIALRTKVQFGYHLSVRSFTGHLQFDHVKSTLNLSVMTADQAQAQGTQRAKEARSLSGGEKSYTQVCLLLALWESVGCPIRCLDEFDVFLDAPNRGICMNLLAEAAKSSEAKQYFFITPLDTGSFIKPDPPVVKISQMKEPNRDPRALEQRRLPFRSE
ncbi:Structural maintenance of chromosomes protein 6 [Tulasnella sp. 424]|nr:Structural maintenance of chromosomes protein 6 [Tulasnella sp. 424]